MESRGRSAGEESSCLDGMDDITKEWFSNARERYNGAVRFAFVLLAVLLGIQLTTFTEYLDTQIQLKRAKVQAEESRALTAAMSQVAAAANALQQTVSDSLEGLLNRLVEDLKSDFAALDAKVADLRGDRPIPAEPRRNLAMQQLNAPGLLQREIVLGNDLEVKIREAPNIGDLYRLLAAWIDENIIRLRFAEVTEGWKQCQSAIVEKADVLKATLRKFPSATAERNSTFSWHNCEDFAFGRCERGTSEQLSDAKYRYLPVRSEAWSTEKRNKWEGPTKWEGDPFMPEFDLDQASLRTTRVDCHRD